MRTSDDGGFTAFEGHRRLATGTLAMVASKTKEALDRDTRDPVLIFDDATGEQVDLDLRGTVDDVLRRLPRSSDGASTAEAPRGRGRPKLGVVAREVTLLPRHWDWLNSQPGGASVALRRLVDEARKTNATADRVRRSREAAYRFLSALAANLPGYEETLRALFAGNATVFDSLSASWPVDVRNHVQKLAAPSFDAIDVS